ncbi:MAG: hypothetical protein SVG88_04390 [Halobacteriales archaeon]|nr:hypothetical protein [Halobacteriales archaeon]
MVLGLFAGLVTFLVNLLVGGLGIYLGARIVADIDDYRHAIFTALIGAIVWAIAGVFVGWIPLLGPVLTLLAWIGVINWRYPGGWVDAGIIALVAWLSVVVLLFLLGPILGPVNAFGLPGV